jgi:hypothetical protein
MQVSFFDLANFSSENLQCLQDKLAYVQSFQFLSLFSLRRRILIRDLLQESTWQNFHYEFQQLFSFLA